MSDEVSRDFGFVTVTQSQEESLNMVRKEFEHLARIMGQLCCDTSSRRYQNGYMRLEEAKYWFVKAICNDR